MDNVDQESETIVSSDPPLSPRELPEISTGVQLEHIVDKEDATPDVDYFIPEKSDIITEENTALETPSPLLTSPSNSEIQLESFHEELQEEPHEPETTSEIEPTTYREEHIPAGIEKEGTISEIIAQPAFIPFVENYQTLVAMGFTDKKRNIEVLVKHKNNIEPCVNELLGYFFF